MRQRAFAQVDVFTRVPTRGNPVAVVLDGSDLTTEQMLDFTAWTNLSEATFVLPPTVAEADYQVRIFCPGRELPFAGHPTLGTARAWLAAGGRPLGADVVQQCGAGLVTVRIQDDESLAFAAPALRQQGPLPEADVDLLVRGLGVDHSAVVDHQWCDNGPQWQTLLLHDAEAVLAVTPDPQLLAGRDVGIVGPSSTTGVDFEVRAFFPGNSGLAEDPVTGSLNAAIAQWLIPTGRAPTRYTAAQGTRLGRQGRVHLESLDGVVWVGGACVDVVTGEVCL